MLKTFGRIEFILRRPTVLLLLFSAGLSGCQAKPSVAIAACESKTYDQIGFRSGAEAALPWLKHKAELVRVCMVQQGFRFKYTEEWRVLVADAPTLVYKRHGMYNTPHYKVPREVHAAATAEMQTMAATALMHPANWSN